jgi:hypothetical protein
MSSAMIPSGTAAIHTIPTQVEGDIGTMPDGKYRGVIG